LSTEAGYKPSFYFDEITRNSYKLLIIAEGNYEPFYEPIKLWGKSPLKVLFFLWMNDGWSSAKEVSRRTGLPIATVYDGLASLREAGFLEEKGSMFRLIPRFHKKI